MFDKYCALIVLFFSFSIIAPERQLGICSKGSVLSKADRQLLLTWQKGSVFKKTPAKIMQQMRDLKEHNQVKKDIAQLREYSKHAIDWRTLEKKNNSFFLFAFGSLINTKNPMNSACQPNINIPGVAFGMRRIYSMTHPDPHISCVGLPTEGHEDEELRLDTQITGNCDDHVNGILLKFKVGTPQYQHLKEREKKYDLIPIKVVDYRSLFTSPLFYDAYILSGASEEVSAQKKPHIAYNSVVVQGAHIIEQQGNTGFVSLLLDTTYLPNGITLRSWIKEQ